MNPTNPDPNNPNSPPAATEPNTQPDLSSVLSPQASPNPIAAQPTFAPSSPPAPIEPTAISPSGFSPTPVPAAQEPASLTVHSDLSSSESMTVGSAPTDFASPTQSAADTFPLMPPVNPLSNPGVQAYPASTDQSLPNTPVTELTISPVTSGTNSFSGSNNPTDLLSSLSQVQSTTPSQPFPPTPGSETSMSSYNPIPSSESTTPIPEAPPANAGPSEQAPTDLSHLLNDNQPMSSDTSSFVPPVTQPETLVQPTNGNGATPVVPTVTSERGHGDIPKWVITLMIILLVAVAGASAYFILGVGQNQPTTSLPAVSQPAKQTITKPPAQSPSPQANTNTATGSANFGQLNGSTGSQPTTTSAAELLRQRQQGK